eukprot:2506532-Rhodomonas_salina.1
MLVTPSHILTSSHPHIRASSHPHILTFRRSDVLTRALEVRPAGTSRRRHRAQSEICFPACASSSSTSSPQVVGPQPNE